MNNAGMQRPLNFADGSLDVTAGDLEIDTNLRRRVQEQGIVSSYSLGLDAGTFHRLQRSASPTTWRCLVLRVGYALPTFTLHGGHCRMD